MKISFHIIGLLHISSAATRCLEETKTGKLQNENMAGLFKSSMRGLIVEVYGAQALDCITRAMKVVMIVLGTRIDILPVASTIELTSD